MLSGYEVLGAAGSYDIQVLPFGVGLGSVGSIHGKYRKVKRPFALSGLRSSRCTLFFEI